MSSVRQILKTAKWKCYVPRLLHVTTDGDPDCRLELCEWIQRKMGEDAQFLSMIVWTDGVTFKLNGTVNWHNCVYWSAENSNVYVDKTVNLPGLSV
jgi:hypothetical protein